MFAVLVSTIDLYLFSGSVRAGRLYDHDQRIISHFLLLSCRRAMQKYLSLSFPLFQTFPPSCSLSLVSNEIFNSISMFPMFQAWTLCVCYHVSVSFRFGSTTQISTSLDGVMMRGGCTSKVVLRRKSYRRRYRDVR